MATLESQRAGAQIIVIIYNIINMNINKYTIIKIYNIIYIYIYDAEDFLGVYICSEFCCKFKFGLKKKTDFTGSSLFSFYKN